MAKKKKQKTSKKPAQEADVKVTDKEPPAKKPSVGPIEFLQQVRNEGRKVTWTSLKETQISSVMVLVMVFIMSIFFLIVDQIWRFIIPIILNLF
jgi:preprotein translocase subunit SecE